MSSLTPPTSGLLPHQIMVTLQYKCMVASGRWFPHNPPRRQSLEVLQGSRAFGGQPVDSVRESTWRLRQELINKKILVQANDGTADLVFASDYMFKNPSAAACVILGDNVNGLDYWKGPDGRSLGEILDNS